MNGHLDSKVIQLASKCIIKIPNEVSAMLPSRGMVMIKILINDMAFEVPLEPDGKGSHWFEVTDDLIGEQNLKVGDRVSMDFDILNEWKDPVLPTDMAEAIKDAGITNEFESITSKSKWDWLRWIRSTKNPETRRKRIQVMISKLYNGDRRPCCFNRNICTVMEVSKSGVLLDQ